MAIAMGLFGVLAGLVSPDWTTWGAKVALCVGVLVLLAARPMAGSSEPSGAVWDLLQTERTLALDLVAGGVAHQVNNPLMTVGVNLEFLRTQPEWPTEGPAAEAMQDAEVSLDRIARVVRGFTAFGSAPPPAVDVARSLRFDLSEVLHIITGWASREPERWPVIQAQVGPLPVVVGCRSEVLHLLTRLVAHLGCEGEVRLTVQVRAADVVVELQGADAGALQAAQAAPLGERELDEAILAVAVSRFDGTIEAERADGVCRYRVGFRRV